MPPLLAEGQIVHNHRVVRRIGTGGMGEVYEAVHQAVQKRVAIKVLHPNWCKSPDLIKRFFNEALATNLVRHPAMVAIHDHGTLEGGMPFIIMEYLDGESLRKQMGLLPALDVARIGFQVASGLASAHEKRIVHRDLKPDNIMLLHDDALPGGRRAKLLDFGLAKLAAEHQAAGAQLVRTRDGVALGTPEYMAPEQWLGAARVDGRADVYSLGVVIYEIVAGLTPFVSTEVDKLRSMHLYTAPLPLSERKPETPAVLSALVGEMLSKTQAQRPTMAEVATRLEALMHSLERNNEPEKPEGSEVEDATDREKERTTHVTDLGDLPTSMVSIASLSESKTAFFAADKAAEKAEKAAMGMAMSNPEVASSTDKEDKDLGGARGLVLYAAIGFFVASALLFLLKALLP